MKIQSFLFIILALAGPDVKIAASDFNGHTVFYKYSFEAGIIQKDSTVFTCPMHPEVISDKPGRCPKCGMNLIQVKQNQVVPQKNTPPAKNKKANINQAVQTVYSCPMHPEIKSDKPGSCPKCGMDLIKEKYINSAIIAAPVNVDTNPDSSQQMNHSDELKNDSSSQMKNVETIDNLPGKIKTIKSKLPPRLVRYDLHVKDTIVTYGKKPKRAIAVNGQIPMPTLTFTEGDTAEIWVHNEMDEETSLHWHGLFLPNQMDGVPFLTQMPIKSGSTYVYKFPIIQHGTHWYHSHSKLQEQIGMYGSFIMNKREELDIPTIPIVISEWTDLRPEEVHRSLKSATDWFAIRKGSTQSYSEAIMSGHFDTKIINEWKRMSAMDVSDVFYDRFLINGMNTMQQPQFKAGDKVRLRIANGGASDYFWLTYSGGKITVIASDGNDVEPVVVDRLLIAVSETYDVIISIPENKTYEFLFTAEDRTNSASLWLGVGEEVSSARLPKLNYFEGMKMMNDMMDMRGNIIEVEGMLMHNQQMDMNVVMYPEIMSMNLNKNRDVSMPQYGDSTSLYSESVTLNYAMLKSAKKTSLPSVPVKELKFELTGNMNRYVWSLDNKVVSEADKILIKKGEIVRMILFNNSMMRHPMHLHGHDFRLLNGQGEYAPLKNIIDIMPMERDTIEFYASENGGDWFFHCHILYHMMSGMGRVLSYENSPVNSELTDIRAVDRGFKSDDRHLHLMGRIGIETNGSDGELMLGQTRWNANAMWHLGYHAMHGYETELLIGRYFGKMQWLKPYIGFDYHYKQEESNHEHGSIIMNGSPENIFGNEDENLFGQASNKNNRQAATLGFGYTLPLLFIADFRIDSDGKIRFQLSREDIAVTKRLRFALMVNTDKEYMTGFRYIWTKYISFSTHYDSDMAFGAGLTFTY